MAARDGRLCVPKTVADPVVSESGAFAAGAGATPAAVQLRLARRKARVSPTEAAIFDALDTGATHDVAVFTYDGRKRLATLKLTFLDGQHAVCMKRKPTYGTWSFEPEGEQCRCNLPR
jgi:hypothetical protein